MLWFLLKAFDMKKQIIDNESDSLVVEEATLEKAVSERMEPADIQPRQKRVVENRKQPEPDASGFAADDAVTQFPEWNQHSHFKKDKLLIADVIAMSDLMIFEMSGDHRVIKNSWANLPARMQEVFEEIIYSLPLNKTSSRDDDGCYTFSYCDEEFDVSVISIVIEGKAALFYKNLKPSKSW